MDAYPSQYVEHNLPFVVVSGLGTDTSEPYFQPHKLLQEHGLNIDSAIPTLINEHAEQLRQEFLIADSRHAPWNGIRSRSRGDLIGFKIRAVGRQYTFPSHKAQPPQRSPDETPPGSPPIDGKHKWVLHSPISPLSPGSPTFPDGVMTPLWVAKHQSYIPSVFISCFDFTSEAGRDTLNDNQLKAEINRIKNLLANSHHPTRYAVILLSDKTIIQAPEIEDRLANIRRATGLDPKNSLFFLPPTSRAEIASFVHNVLSVLQPTCVEYYRDLSKHARRKKNRGNIPPPTAPPTRGTSQTLSSQGWNVRYDFKLGVFAEFRQEMDSACRHYSAAMDTLLDGDGVFETTASWNPRWDDTRLLADTVAVRIIRCLMWNNGPTSAVQSWQNYRDRMRDLVDRRGKGSANYGWQAWESRWARLMAEIIQRVEPPIFAVVESSRANRDMLIAREDVLFVQPEKIFPVGERMPPWQLLHHPGYWFRLAAERAISRRTLAEDLSEEDRMPPGMSPATQVVNRYGTYDTYLVPEPHVEYPLPGKGEGFDHTGEIVDLFNRAVGEFHARGQYRLVDKIHFDMGKELIHAHRYSNALSVLKPLWEGMNWRKEGWWPLVTEVTWALHACAQLCGDEEMIVATEWELCNRALRTKQGKVHDFMNCLDSVKHPEEKEIPRITLNANNVMSALSVTVIFGVAEGHVGEPLQAQVAVRSNAHKNSKPITASKFGITFKGCIDTIELHHEANEGAQSFTEVTLTEAGESKAGAAPSFQGQADLSFRAGEVKVYTFSILFREAGDINLERITVEVATSRFHLACFAKSPKGESAPLWWHPSTKGLRNKRLIRDPEDPSIKVLPKPPKMEIALPNLQAQYYINETVTLALNIENAEEEDTEAVLEVRLLDPSSELLEYSWLASKDPEAENNDKSPNPLGHNIGIMAPGSKRTHSITFAAPSAPAAYTVEVKVLYHLLSDRDVPIQKILSGELIFVEPFEATYDFAPQVHPDPWPSFFHISDEQTTEPSAENTVDKAFGLWSRYLLTVRVGSLAEEDLVVQDAELVVHSVHGGAACTVAKQQLPEPEVDVSPQAVHLRAFWVDVRKFALEDRSSSALETSVSVKWRRKNPIAEESSSDSVTTIVAKPRLVAAHSEPRVLASARPSTTAPGPGLIHLDYTLENPTMHFLTFDISMEASEEFAFSGPKLSALQLLPLSRQTVRYNLTPLVRGAWLSPSLRVQDRYFNKVLRVTPTEGLRGDKRTGVVQVWADVEEGEA
ncbi:uncharacterized protein K452DRAFT_264522 [Aplosporella prunicola CBS 121167]|uniref:Trafficking protein particle complex subunit 11 domain-containing protein n=1 Tax=Aplosporella prunicola CBS 121167 TaxID=1176127 RepID=A0A6A6BPT1_9PEZI|nr:uncharacterized protein K452DRAFT_264522 [Aplosporella prunicola CBS 121167]KAF2145473.1 hypothetical protein K452DRAFT_264522 [Aplosporella prunicola CBS 121167]